MTEKDKDFLEGLAISAACHVLPVRKKQPIAYSYNGVILPALPEWDREMYPYACIDRFQAIGPKPIYNFFAFEKPPYAYNDIYLYSPSGNGDISDVHCAAYSTDAEWSEMKEGSLKELYGELGPLIWSNWNVIDTEGNVKFEASEPIPVYE